MTQVNKTQQQPAPQAGREAMEKTPPAQGAQQTFAEALKKGKGKDLPQAPHTSQAPRGEKGETPASFSTAKGKGEDANFSKGKGEGIHARGESSPLKDSPFSAIARQHRDRQDREPGRKTMPDGDALLASLGGIQPQARTGETQAAPAVQGLDSALTDKLVDRILVSSPESGQGEVRIALKDDLLPGTEVRIQRGADGSLSVRFVTDNPVSERLLGKEQLSSLQNALGQTMQTEVRVQTVRTDGSMSSEADSGGQQNRGGQQGQQDQGDSRQRSRQYDLFDGEPV